MNTSSVFHRKLLCIAGLLVAAILPGVTETATAAQLTGATVSPNWAFGAPQRPLLAGCSDADPIRCFGHFGLGPLSDVLDIGFVGRPFYTEASLAENFRANVFGLLETGNEQLGDWWNLTIPNARWLGLGIGYRLRDGDDGAFFGDSIAFVNLGGLAHILWWSNNSDAPPLDQQPPLDFRILAAQGGAPFSSFFDVFVELNFDNSTFDNSGHPLPRMEECPANDATCTQTLPDSLPTVPEPASLLLVATALAGLGVARRRR